MVIVSVQFTHLENLMYCMNHCSKPQTLTYNKTSIELEKRFVILVLTMLDILLMALFKCKIFGKRSNSIGSNHDQREG